MSTNDQYRIRRANDNKVIATHSTLKQAIQAARNIYEGVGVNLIVVDVKNQVVYTT